MYAWSNDNDTDTDSGHSEPELYEFSSSPKANTTAVVKSKNQSQNTDSRDYPSKVANVYKPSDDYDFFESATDGSDTTSSESGGEESVTVSSDPVPSSDSLSLLGDMEKTAAASDYEDLGALGSNGPSVAAMDSTAVPAIDALPPSTSASDPTVPSTPLSAPASVFSNSSLAIEIAAALAAPNLNGPQGQRVLSESFDQVVTA